MLKGSSFALAMIASFIFLVFAYGRMGQVPFDKSVLIVLAVFLMLYSARAFEVEMKYQSPKFVSDPIHSTANWSDSRVIGNYVVVRLGAFDAYGFKYKGGNEGTAIIRKEAINKIGESIGATCKLTQITVDELPPEVYYEKDFLKLNEPLYRGDIDTQEVQQLKRAEISKVQTEMVEKDKFINMQKELLSDKFDTIEKFVEGTSRLHERKKGVGDFFKGIFSNKEENNDREQP